MNKMQLWEEISVFFRKSHVSMAAGNSGSKREVGVSLKAGCRTEDSYTTSCTWRRRQHKDNRPEGAAEITQYPILLGHCYHSNMDTQ